MRILHIEPDRAFGKTYGMLLSHNGFNVYSTDDYDEGADLAKVYEYDLILCEYNEELLADLIVRKAPVMVLTDKCPIERIVDCLIMWETADCQPKTIDIRELCSRIRAIICRSKGRIAPVLEFGGYQLDLESRGVYDIYGRKMPLTTKEYRLTELMVVNKGRTLSKEQILNDLYNGENEPDLKIIDVFICKLRKKLPEAPIKTIWGRGYRAA